MLYTPEPAQVTEPADFNALAAEYLRLCYHGLRAKDNSFNVSVKTDFDKSIGKMNIIPQDIGQSLIESIQQCFLCCDSEKETNKAESFEPTVSVSSKRIGAQVEIRVKDNGNGYRSKGY